MVYHAMDMRLNHFAAILDAVAVQTAATTVESEEGVEESVQEEEGGSTLHFRFRQLLCCVLCVCVWAAALDVRPQQHFRLLALPAAIFLNFMFRTHRENLRV